MINELILFFSFFLSFMLTIYGTPVTQKVAHRYNLLDFPDGKLKQHEKPVPYMGGVIIYFSFISPVSLLWNFSQELLGILFASSILLIVGLFDDLKALSPQTKFLFQIIATYILVKSGIRIQLLFIPPWLNSVLSFMWILSIINAFNIIDILDGMAASIGALISLSIFVISLFSGNYIVSLLSISLAGALMAFLRFNWQPARIYLGDAGSMFIGLVIGTLTIMVDYTVHNEGAFVSALIILFIPIFDMVYVIVLRLLKGRNPFLGSPDHFALRLKKRFKLSASRTVLILVCIQMLLSSSIIVIFFSSLAVTIFILFFFIVALSLLGLYLSDTVMEK